MPITTRIGAIILVLASLLGLTFEFITIGIFHPVSTARWLLARRA